MQHGTSQHILGDVGAAGAALENNFRTKVTYFPRVHPGMAVTQIGGATCVDSSTACDMFNCVVGGSFASPDALSHAQAVHAYYTQRQMPVAWWLGPSCDSALRRPVLEAAGFRHTDTEIGMVAALADLTHAPTPPELRVERVQSETQVHGFARVLASLFPKEAREVERYYSAVAHTLAQATDVARFFVGYVQERPVATASLFLDTTLAGLYDLATRTAFRHRGFGAALASVALRDAHLSGYEVAGLLASHSGQPIYARMGFHAVCAFDVFTPKET